MYGALFAVVLGGLLLAFAPAGAVPGAHPIGAPRAASVPAATLHGDLVVSAANSPYVISPATTSSSVYQQEGNVTVQAGGVLQVENEQVQFLQFVSNTGTLPERTSHIFSFTDQGSVTFTNSWLTTDANLLNAYQKLTINVSNGGSLTLANTTFEFPGWINVYGSGSSLNANSSIIRGTATPPTLIENKSIIGDTVWAPTIQVTGGAHATFASSELLNTYKDNWTAYGTPGPIPLSVGSTQSLGGASTLHYLGLPVPTDSENVTRALAYDAFSGGSLQLFYNTNTSQTSVGSTLDLEGTSYPLGPITFNAALTYVSVPIPGNAIAAVNTAGMVAWLESTGAYDQAATTGWNLGATGGAYPVNISFQELTMIPVAPFNITVSGAGSTLTAVDSTFDLNWNLTPGSVLPPGATATPWGSNKLDLTDGATAYVANLTVTNARTAVFWNDSAILPDATSTAYVYRWVQVPVRAPGSVPVVGAQLSAFYSYDSSQTNNATATALNALPSADPALAAYANAWDTLHGITSYGASGPDGNAQLLLATAVIQQPTLPDGVFLGGYHLGVRLASVTGSVGVQWGYATLTAYPNGMTPGAPDTTPAIVYANYVPDVAVQSVAIGSDGVIVPGTTVDIGSQLFVQATLTDSGTAPVPSISSFLTYGNNTTILASGNGINNLLPGDTALANYSWVVNESTIGLHGTFTGTFELTIVWGNGFGPTGGTLVVPVEVRLGPSPLAFQFSPPTGANGVLNIDQEYLGTGTVQFNGTGNALINITVVSASGQRFDLGAAQAPSGPIEVGIIPIAAMPSGEYTVVATAYYNNVTATVTTPNAFSIAAPASAPTSFLDQKFGPFTVLEWIVIAIAAVLVAVGGLLMLRRSARGKLVECGECGTPIPESATVCPKCGAEFETDIVRCSRCGSTIPSNSEVCPECAAQLLGSPDAEKSDPERQGYNDVVERYRTEAKRELGDNYNEGAFWDWWKRQQSYVPFSQYKLQQSGSGPRAGMGAPPSGQLTDATAPPPTATPAPPAAAPAARRAATAAAPAPASVRPAATPAPAPAATPAAAPAAPTAGMKPCSNCGKEIPPDYLVCPFCGAVTQ